MIVWILMPFEIAFIFGVEEVLDLLKWSRSRMYAQTIILEHWGVPSRYDLALRGPSIALESCRIVPQRQVWQPGCRHSSWVNLIFLYLCQRTEPLITHWNFPLPQRSRHLCHIFIWRLSGLLLASNIIVFTELIQPPLHVVSNSILPIFPIWVQKL